jgi:hypothetical protein
VLKQREMFYEPRVVDKLKSNDDHSLSLSLLMNFLSERLRWEIVAEINCKIEEKRENFPERVRVKGRILMKDDF